MVTSGSFGDVNPFVGLALELRARGYHPVIVSHPFWREWIESTGIECEAFHWDTPPLDNLALWMNPAALTQIASESYRKLAAVVRNDDVLVSLTMLGLGPLMAAPLVAETRGIPWIAAVLEPLSFFSAHETLVLPSVGGQPPVLSTGPAVHGSQLWWYQNVFGFECRCVLAMGAAMQALRPGLGLSLAKREYLADFRHADLVLALFSEVLANRQPDWPQHAVLAGFVTYDGYQQQAWPRELERFLNDGPPPIVFTLSSDALTAPDPGFWVKSMVAARAAGRRAVIVGLTLPGDADAVSPAGNRDVCLVRGASFAELFPRAVAVVHHGGIGTTALALQAGKPMLVIPGDYSQPDTAARLQRVGVARTIQRRHFTGVTAAAELRLLLTSPTYSQAADAATAVLAHENGARTACDAIENLVRNRNAHRGADPMRVRAAASLKPS